MNQNIYVKEEYEFLCDILKNYFKEKLMLSPKQIKEKIFYIIKYDNMEFTCEFLKESNEINFVGK